VVWNYFLQRRKDFYLQTGNTLSFAQMCKELTLLKQLPDFAFLADCDSQALQQVLRDLCTAFANFLAGRANFPKRKSRRRTPNAFRIPQRVRIEGGNVSIPKVGLVEVLLHRAHHHCAHLRFVVCQFADVGVGSPFVRDRFQHLCVAAKAGVKRLRCTRGSDFVR
jgi:transposase